MIIQQTVSALDRLEQAAQSIYRFMPPSPHISWPLLNQRVGTTVWVKHENHNPTGSFKLRGGLHYMAHLRQQQPDLRHVITATRGNHGQSIAYAASRFGFDATIVVPKGNSHCKNAAMQAYHATLIEAGTDIEAAVSHARQWADASGALFIASFDDTLVNGVATYSMELLRALPDLDVVYVPIGMGSGICGLMAARDALKLNTRIVGVVAQQADAYAKSFEAGRVVNSPRSNTMADGIACRMPKPEALTRMLNGVERIARVSEADILHAIAVYFTDTHMVAEGASAAALAAILQDAPKLTGLTVGVIHTGGNVDTPILLEALSR